MKTFVPVLGLILLVGALLIEGRPKRSVVVSAPLVAASHVVASVPVVHTASVHSHPTTVVKTEQVHDGVRSSYSYVSEVKSEPAVVHHTHAAVAAAPVAAVSTVHHTVPTHYYYPASFSYYSPYHYAVGK